MKEKEMISVGETAQERFKKAYLAARKSQQKVDHDINRRQIIVVADHGRRIYRPYPWDH